MVTSTSLYTNPASVAATKGTGSNVSLPAGIKSYEQEAAKPKATGTAANQQDFLKLFTTQLQNQNPLDPVKNEAFVAQLAQFSQLEATTNMAAQMATVAAALNGDRLMSGAALIGKSVLTAGSNFSIKPGDTIQGVLDLPQGADGLQVDIVNSANELVNRSTLGQQPAGNFYFSWNGQSANGEQMPAGSYRFRVIGTSGGNNIIPTVSLRKTIQGVSQDAKTGETLIEVQGGTMKLADVSRIGS
jgi:flagellar basal-body rod modification protein FlgD